jgi:hypothetical protein
MIADAIFYEVLASHMNHAKIRNLRIQPTVTKVAIISLVKEAATDSFSFT